MSIRQLPPVLCLHMKRFKATDKGATMKVDSRVVFPVSHLEMAPFTSAPVLAARCHLKGLLLAEPPRYGLLSPLCFTLLLGQVPDLDTYSTSPQHRNVFSLYPGISEC